MSKYCLILGAKSDIARALAHTWARNGYSLYLAGRNAAESLAADAADIQIRYKVDTRPLELDIRDFGGHSAFYSALDPKPEIVICVVGYMPAQASAQADGTLARAIVESNFTGCAVLLDIAAADMESRKSGGIIGISSVAGERGRASNYWYGSAKAGFTAYLSGLRNRLAFAGVHVMTVNPGFVATKMTAGLPLPAPLTAKPDAVALDIWKAWKKKKNVLFTKWMWRYIMLIIRNIPEWKFKKMKL
jgi:decaprenylphospho-beta-D-erythro-pentofuranosid-2-ulose 2-reductase